MPKDTGGAFLFREVEGEASWFLSGDTSSGCSVGWTELPPGGGRDGDGDGDQDNCVAPSSPAWSSWPSLGLDSGCSGLLSLGGALGAADEGGWVKLDCCDSFECLRAWKSLTS
jgi:hypothetical protein